MRYGISQAFCCSLGLGVLRDIRFISSGSFPDLGASIPNLARRLLPEWTSAGRCRPRWCCRPMPPSAMASHPWSLPWRASLSAYRRVSALNSSEKPACCSRDVCPPGSQQCVRPAVTCISGDGPGMHVCTCHGACLLGGERCCATAQFQSNSRMAEGGAAASKPAGPLGMTLGWASSGTSASSAQAASPSLASPSPTWRGGC